MTYRVKRGVIHSKKGIPCTPRFLVDGRLAFQMEESGVLQVDYLSRAQLQGNGTVFLKRLWDGFRIYLEKDKLNYAPEYANTQVWPFCIEAEWDFFGYKVKHRVMAVDESIVFQVQTPSDWPTDIVLKLEYYDSFSLTPRDVEDIRFGDGGVERKWKTWEHDQESNKYWGGFEESPRNCQAETEELDLNHYKEATSYYSGCTLHIGVGADFRMDCFRTPLNTKNILKSPKMEPDKDYSFMIAFHPEQDRLRAKLDDLIDHHRSKIEGQYARYAKAAARSPRLVSPYKKINQYLGLIPVYHESLKVQDRPGAIKANSYAWVWGWDGMTANYATAYWNDTEHLRDMLLFYRDTASEEFGIAHALSRDLRFVLGCALPSQGMYITLLQQYYSLTGDQDFVRETYPFAKWIFNKTLALEMQGTGLCEGPSMYPDFPIFMKETGKDLSGLNNTIFYCTVRSMDYLAILVNDQETASEAKRVMGSMERHFLPLFFDSDKGFIVSSVDSVTLERRNSFNSNAVKWENNYCRELMEQVFQPSLDFFEKHIVSAAGLREIPVWSDAYSMDANQLHCWWPVTGEYYMRLINEYDRKDLIDKWIGWIEYWSEMLMCPEGISCYIETARPELDRWNTLPGLWYGYSMRGWYQAIIHGVFGLDVDAGGMTFFPYSGEEMSLRNLSYKGCAYDVKMKGSGPYIRSIQVDDTLITGTNKLPVNIAGSKKRIKVQVNRTQARVYPVHIKCGYGIEIHKYSHDAGVIQAELGGLGTCRLKIAATARPTVHDEDTPVDVRYDEKSGIATLDLEFKRDEMKRVRISVNS